VLDPMTRVAEAARTHPRRVQHMLRSYFLRYAKTGEQSTVAAPWRRAACILSVLEPETRKAITNLLEAQGAWIRRAEPPSPEQKTAALQEFATRFWPYRSPVDASTQWQ
jgi:hypothetical protein